MISDGQQGNSSYSDPMKKVIDYGQGGVDAADVVIPKDPSRSPADREEATLDGRSRP